MRTRDLEEFLVFSEELNYSAVAKKLFVTRSTLRDHLARLEDDLGVALIEKDKPEKVALTPLGKRFVSDAHRLVDEINGVIATYRSLNDNFLTVNVGSVDFVWMEPSIHVARKRVMSEHPEKVIEIVSVDRSDTFDALEAGVVDVVVASVKNECIAQADFEAIMPPDSSMVKVNEDETLLLVGEGHRLYGKEQLRASDLNGETIVLPRDVRAWWVRDGVGEQIRAHGGNVTLKGEVFSDSKTYFARDFDRVLGGMSRSHASRFEVEARGDCRAVPLVDVSLVSSFYAVFKNDFLQNETARLLFDQLGKISQELAGSTCSSGLQD